MQAMPLVVGWDDVALRLSLAIIAGVLIGLNRDEHGRPAGLRTTILVCLAACVAMIQTNLLLPTTGKEPGSFVTIDLMRLPLGILSGMGFLGAGAIIRRPDGVLGVTTAATLWIVSVIGLCFGGGQIALGITATVLALVALSGLKILERYIRHDRRGALVMRFKGSGPGAGNIGDVLAAEGYRVIAVAVSCAAVEHVEMKFDVRWRGPRVEPDLPGFVTGLRAFPDVENLQWSPEGLSRI